MTDQEAIETINVMQASHSHIRRNDAEWFALESAKDALREKQEREKGCKVCNEPCYACDYPCGSVGDDNWDVCIFTNHSYYHRDPRIKFCSNCGRRLPEEIQLCRGYGLDYYIKDSLRAEMERSEA